MQNIVFKNLILLMWLIPGTLIYGQNQPEVRLSLDDARSYALEHNRNLINAGLGVDEAGEMLKEAISNGLPQLSATVDYNNFFGSTASLGLMPGMEIEFNPTSNLSVSVSQLIFSGSFFVGVQSAKLYKEVASTSKEKTALDVKSQVTQAYYLVLVSQQFRDVVASNLNNMEDLLEKTRSMVDVGIAEELDYDQLTVQYGMLEDGFRAANRQVELAENMLRLQMGLTADVAVVLTDPLEFLVADASIGESLAMPFSLDRNLDYQLMELQTGLAEKQILMEQSAYLPTIAGFYNFTEKLLKPEFDLTPNHVIGLNMSIPIFSSGMRRSRVNQARIGLEMAQNQKALVSEQLQIQEKQLRFNLQTALEQYERQVSNLEVARRVFQSMTSKYEQGLVSSLDLTTANTNYLQAENSYISSLLQLMEAQVAMATLLHSI